MYARTRQRSLNESIQDAQTEINAAQKDTRY